MTTPLPVLPYAIRPRRDYFGITSLPLAIIFLSVFFAMRGKVITGTLEVTLLIFACVCGALSIGFAITGIVLMRGRSIVGWITVGIYATFMLVRFFQLP